jgi:hypothetical protein
MRGVRPPERGRFTAESTPMRAANATGAPRRPGRHWVFTAVVMPLGPLAWWLATIYSQRWEACTAAHPGAKDQGLAGPCAGSLTIGAFALLPLIPLAATTVVGLIIGIVEGRRRYRFAHRRWICALVVTLTGPWTMLTYAVGYGIGRLLPALRPSPAADPSPVAVAHQHGWHTAVQLCTALAAGRPLPHVVAPGFLNTEPVYLDVPFMYARFYGINVTFQPGASVAIGSPAFVAAAAIGDLIGNSAGRARAANLSRTQWREHRTVRVVVTASATWCCVDGRWLAFDHAAVMEYHLNGAACILGFAEVEPLMLAGPSAACHAVIFAYLSGGASWQQMPFLHAITAAASASVVATATPRPGP